MSEIAPGSEIPSLELPPIDRTTLALYAGASGDHNPVHIDIDFARRAGMQDEIEAVRNNGEKTLVGEALIEL